ncbi:centrosomal protein CCDC61 [Dryobates pubescens]|uniref:centrosomal protein CCDC61 n=1 Tax=Dryobates pubescens TaxID=118200 RepID=UPI0023B9B9DC|nr:centrosomal protein CCDC61 [Dryobates pubescens]
MEQPRRLQADYSFRQGAHSLRLSLGRSLLELEVEAHRSAERWRGRFDAAAIEELSHKTGNFKQFGIFCSMLEAALLQSSDSVSLELLTYSDLKTLHSLKTGVSPPRPPRAAPSPLGTKRYLILVYSVEFDRIHYPLPLSYAGRPEPAELCRSLRELREQLRELRARRGDERREAEIRRLRDDLQRALEEKAAAEARSQRENRRLAGELAEAKAAERRLQLRVRSLTAELASYRRGQRTPSGGSAPRPPPERRSAAPRDGRGRAPSRSPSPAAHPPRFDPTAYVRAQQRRRKEAELRKGRKLTPTRRPLRTSSSSSFNAPKQASSQKLPPSKLHGKENCSELAEIDARLKALQEYMESLDPHS